MFCGWIDTFVMTNTSHWLLTACITNQDDNMICSIPLNVFLHTPIGKGVTDNSAIFQTIHCYTLNVIIVPVVIFCYGLAEKL